MNSFLPGKLLLVSLPGPYAANTPQFPLGIGYLASMLKQDRPVQTVHYQQFEDAQHLLPNVVNDFAPAFVGLTCTTFNRASVQRVCQWLRAAHPQIKIILGGVHVSFMFEQGLRNYGADCVVIGEGEQTLRELCTTLENNRSLHEVRGCAFLDEKALVVTATREVVLNLDDLPLPDYSFAADLLRSSGMGFLITSRGCPVQCSFCSTSSYWGQHVRTNSPRRVVDEMELLTRDYGVQKIFFHDDTFNLGMARVRAICEEIQARGLNLEWGVSCRVHPVSEEMIDLMVASGCRHICWGIESGSEKILASIGKKINRSQIKRAFELCRKHLGVLSVGAFTMVGNPGETEETISESIDFLNSLPMTDSPSTSLLYLLPGTELYNRLTATQTIQDNYWIEHDDVPFYTMEHPLEQLQSWSQRISRSGDIIPYDRKRHFWNQILFQHEEQAITLSSELDLVIPPEIKDDELYEIIQQLSQHADITTVLEIGSSAGGGSTEAFVKGLQKNPHTTKLFCMEVSVPRFQQLQSRYQHDSFVHCYNVSSVPISCFPSERELELFYSFIPTALNNYPLEQVMGWLRQDIDYIRQTNAPENGIRLIKQENDIKTFDMVLIDGSEFLGRAELEEVYGARIILLDDINGFKNYHNRQRLLADPNYDLLHENVQLRNGYSVFIKKTDAPLPIHFFTIVLNGEPFIRHHIDIFQQLTCRWHWHIVEGVADLVNDTAWSVSNGGQITDELHANGLSNDGTSTYLDELKTRYPDQVTIYRQPAGKFWNGKLEMVNAPLAHINEECLLWQVDSDELWDREALEKLRALFLKHPEKTAAYLHCDYFVGPHKFVSSLNTWATYPCDWLRVWRYRPGLTWSAHEPPVLVSKNGRDVASLSPFSRDETIAAGITFQHFAYTLESQVRFKEIYYGYCNAVACWQRLQKASGPVKAADYLPWALPDAIVEDWPASAAPHLAEHFFAPLTPPAEQYVSMSVHGATRFEHELRELFRTLRPQTVIETGTFLGQGTTSIIWRAVHDLGLTTDITTIEVNPEHHRLACEHFKANAMNVRAELGLSIPRSKLPDMDAITEEFVIEADSCNGRIYYDHDEASRATRYFSETAFDVPENLLEAALARCGYRPDFVLLDSAGHIGFAEFQHLLTLLKGSCHLMLDDINHCKHARTMQEIRRDPRFKILVESDEKFGFAIVRYTHVDQLIYLRTDAIGDNVLSAGMLPLLKERYRGATLTVVCQDRVAALYDACPFVDSVIAISYTRFMTQSDYRQLIVDKMNNLQPTLLINPIYSHDLHDEFLAHHCQAPLKVAYQGDASNRGQEKFDETSKLYTFLVPNNPVDVSELDHHHTFLKGIGISAPAITPQVWTSANDETWAEELLKHYGIGFGQAIILFPGALLDCKSYPHYDKVLEHLREYPLIVMGGAELRERGDQLCSVHGQRAINLAGQTSLGQMTALMRRARLYLGSDSSGMHIACAVGLTNVVLLGGGHFGRFCPYSPSTTAVCLPLSCYHCNWHCPHSRVHCLHDITPETVLNAIAHALHPSNASAHPRVHIQQNSNYTDTPPVLNGEGLSARLYLKRFSLNR